MGEPSGRDREVRGAIAHALRTSLLSANRVVADYRAEIESDAREDERIDVLNTIDRWAAGLEHNGLDLLDLLDRLRRRAL